MGGNRGQSFIPALQNSSGSVRIGKQDSDVVGNTEQSYKSSNERSKQLDEYSLECTQEFMGMVSWGASEGAKR
jgi:hypothetical protein